MRRWLRDPVALFFALGAGLFFTYGLLQGEGREPVVLSDAGLAVLLGEFEMLTGRPADAGERKQLIDDYYRSEVLYREGLRGEIYRDDSMLREAIVDVMRRRVSGALPEPAGRDLVNYYADNIQRYYSEPSITLRQRFFREPPEAPEAMLEALVAGEAISSDPPPQGQRFPAYGESMLRGLFGPTIVESLRSAPLNHWFGPLESASGWHLFRVEGRHPAKVLPFARVENQVLADYQAEVVSARLEDFLELHRDRYPLQVGSP